MMTHPGEAGGEGQAEKSAHAEPTHSMNAEALRREVERLREREQQIVELLGAKSPDKILHDLRNVLNELQLLRILAERGDA
jgi:hypothetical protein